MPLIKYRQRSTGKNFEDAVCNAGITRQQLAEMIGVHPTTFTYWYARGVTREYADTVADLLDLNVKKILSTNKRKARTKLALKTEPKTEPKTVPEPRTVDIELLQLIANMRLSPQQEATLHSLALTFLGEES